MKTRGFHLILILSLFVVLSNISVYAATTAAGTCGEGLIWELDDQGIFTVSGTGMIPGYGSLENTPWHIYRKDIKEVILNEGISSVGRFAFAGCNNLISVTFPSTLVEAQALAFEGCRQLYQAHISDMGMWAELGFVWDSSDPVEEASLPRELYLNGELVREVIIPQGTSFIAPWAFRHFSSITSVVIPEGVSTIGTFAFADCTELTSMALPSTLKSIGAAAFSGCSSLNVVDVADIGTWLNVTMDNTTANPLLISEEGKELRVKGQLLTELVIPKGVTEIRKDAFAWCTKLVSITIPDGVTAIGERAFYICASVCDITLPSTLLSIGENAFYACDAVQNLYLEDLETWINLEFGNDKSNPLNSTREKTIWLNGIKMTKVVIPEGITSLRNETFARCTGITQVILPSTITFIGDHAFAWCCQLKKVVFKGNPPNLGKNILYACSNVSCYYRDNTEWNTFDKENYGGNVKWNACMPTVINTQPSSITVDVGSTAFFSIKTSGIDLLYQWQYSVNGNDWKNITLKGSGSKTDKLAVEATYNKSNRMYRCVITDMCEDTLISNVAVLNINNSIHVTEQPKDVSSELGNKNVSFYVNVSGENLKYCWQYKVPTGKRWYNSPAEGAETNTLIIPVTRSRDGYEYRCVITDKYGNIVTSQSAYLAIRTPLAINIQPKDVFAVLGDGAVLFKVNALGDGLKYCWQYKIPTGKNWYNSPAEGAKTNTLTIPVTRDRNGYAYRCNITDKYGKVITSQLAYLTVRTPLVINTQPKDMSVTVGGEEVLFKVKASGDGLKYCWQYKVPTGNKWYNSPAEGAKTNTLSIPPTRNRDGYCYRCIITDKYENVLTTVPVKLMLKE